MDKLENYCITCGQKLKDKRSSYCNRCVGIQNSEIARKKREKDVLYGKASVRRIKKYLLETDRKCSICGITNWMGKELTLIIDHINGDASDNRLKNLRLVCSNCDSQLPTYKSKNKNSSRKNRVGYW